MTGTDATPSDTVQQRRPSPNDHAAFRELTNGALPAVQKMAAAWRTGLAGLITLVTTGVVITGETATSGLTVPWRAAVTLAVGGGLGLAVLGLWHALAAEVGDDTRSQSLEEILAHHASVQAYQVSRAVAAAARLKKSRQVVATALGLLLIGVLLTWWAPPAPAHPPAYLKVIRIGGSTCGALISADGGTIRLNVAGVHEPVAIPLTTVVNISIAADCP